MKDGWILAFDTATRATAVALAGPDGARFEARDDPPAGERPRHAAKLLPLCADVLDRGGVNFAELERIAVGIGPGTFTGLRIGVATARALACASQVGLVGVSTLQSMALAALPELTRSGHEAVLAVLDARRGEVFIGVWLRDELGRLGRPLVGPVALGPQDLRDEVARLGVSALAVGEGAIAFREVLERSGAFVPEDGSLIHRVSAASHCRIAWDLEPSDPGRVQPEYLRLPDAELARRAAGKQ